MRCLDVMLQARFSFQAVVSWDCFVSVFSNSVSDRRSLKAPATLRRGEVLLWNINLQRSSEALG